MLLQLGKIHKNASCFLLRYDETPCPFGLPIQPTEESLQSLQTVLNYA